MSRWTERIGAGGTSLEIDVDALDVVRTEQGELESFRKALAVPAQERDMVVNDEHGNPMSTLGVLRLAYVVAGLFIAGLAAALIDACVTEATNRHLTTETRLALFVLLFCTPILLHLLRRLRGASKSKAVRDRFTLTLDAAGFAVRGDRTPLASIERFEAGRRLVLLTKDARRTPLPFSLDSPAENAQLADRLNEALRDTRANNAGAGYRGALPAEEEEAEEEEEEARRRSGR
ncbi:MAG: hypothetical protein KIT84_20530 [Labilithrix sp.]|nr:hypothetical protein [Labilithrix sp.]MCW5813427.1 hypothetical protein [Labilithrix sp.]